MFILWIRKNKTSEKANPKKNDKKSFQKHDEAMKDFRLSHPKIEPASPQDVMTADGLVLAPVTQVKLSKHIQN